MWHVWIERKIHTGFLLVNLKEGDHSEELGIDGRLILQQMLKKYDMRAWTRFMSRRMTTDGLF